MSGTSPVTIKDCNEGAIAALAQALARQAEAGDCFALHGDLGAGKTCFSRHFIHALCGEHVTVASPTFMISQSYVLPTGTLWHYDLYRIEQPEDLEETGLPETLMHDINLIEWPDIATAWLPPHTLHIVFAFGSMPHYRDVTFTGNTLWMKRLQQSPLPNR
jgi:tRNA threonylcarbamoyl adenosine modification protein YjeE